jgi:hypothetical protein
MVLRRNAYRLFPVFITFSRGRLVPRVKGRLPARLTSLMRRELPCERRSGSRGGGGRERDYGQRIGSLPRWIAAT